MEKLLRPTDPVGYNYWCPACKTAIHLDNRWVVSGPEDKPSILPSVITENPHCHVTITDGKINYLQDCQHQLRGQTVDMIAF